jgi:hypothetical protein
MLMVSVRCGKPSAIDCTAEKTAIKNDAARQGDRHKKTHLAVGFKDQFVISQVAWVCVSPGIFG